MPWGGSEKGASTKKGAITEAGNGGKSRGLERHSNYLGDFNAWRSYENVAEKGLA